MTWCVYERFGSVNKVNSNWPNIEVATWLDHKWGERASFRVSDKVVPATMVRILPPGNQITTIAYSWREWTTTTEIKHIDDVSSVAEHHNPDVLTEIFGRVEKDGYWVSMRVTTSMSSCTMGPHLESWRWRISPLVRKPWSPSNFNFLCGLWSSTPIVSIPLLDTPWRCPTQAWKFEIAIDKLVMMMTMIKKGTRGGHNWDGTQN